MRLTLHRFDLPLAHPFTISRCTITVQPTLIVDLEQDGVHGFGEATTNDYYGITWESMAEALDLVRGDLDKFSLADPPETLAPASLWQGLDDRIQHNRFAQCALDLAAHDLWGKLLGKPVYELWGFERPTGPHSNYTIGIDDIDVMVEKLHEKPDWPFYKIKLGTPRDIDMVQELRRHTNSPFRVDANCGWSVDETLSNAQALAPLGVEFIEQPLPAYRPQEEKRLFADSCLPIVADESCQQERDVEECVNRFHGVNVKLPKCGGLTPAKRMLEQARELGLTTMVGCMTESTVGISSIAQLLPLLDYVDMDGAELLAKDIADGVHVDRGVAVFPDTAGCGVTLR